MTFSYVKSKKNRLIGGRRTVLGRSGGWLDVGQAAEPQGGVNSVAPTSTWKLSQEKFSDALQ